jgi:tRNA modification GTPase
MKDTIFALATAPGRSAVAVVRLTGPKVEAALSALGVGPTRARLACLRSLYDAGGELIDRAIVLRFAAPHTFTGEPMAELQVHGGEAVVDAITAALLRAGLRAAEAGEITRRAFENGKLDLDQAEAVADLIDASTSAQARQAAQQLRGALGRRYQGWRETLITALARLEAQIDFADEDLPAGIQEQAATPLRGLRNELDAAIADGARGERIRDGYRIAVMGAPNSGKSSLFNALLGRDAAIVAATPGATRDVIEAILTLGAYRVVLADMAGLRSAHDAIEAEGVRRARAWAEVADMRLWLVDRSLSEGAWREAAGLVRPMDICLLNKADLPAGTDAPAAYCAASRFGASVMDISVLAPDGAERVRSHLQTRVTGDLSGGEFPAVTRGRHRVALTDARDHLVRALADLGQPELAAEDVRLAARSLDRVRGRIGAEEILDEVFASFCIGK